MHNQLKNLIMNKQAVIMYFKFFQLGLFWCFFYMGKAKVAKPGHTS